MRKYLFVYLLLASGFASGQGLGLWSGISVEKKLNRSFTLNVSGQMRFTENVSVLKTYLGEAGLEYKLNKYFGASAYYRYIGRRKHDKDADDYYYRSFHRFYGNLTFDYKLAKWLKFDYRFRYQNQFKDDESGLVNSDSYFRHKFEFSYKNKSRFSPHISADVFYLLGTGFDQIRYKTGLSANVTKKQSVDVSIFADKPIVGSEKPGPVIAVNYKIKLY
jgi:hypothetical protein